MPSVVTHCTGKLNLFLELVSRRADGYHDLDSVVVPAPLVDRLEVLRAAGGGIHLHLAGEAPGIRDLPRDEGNLAVRAAAAALREAGASGGLEIHLEKNIPAGAGLGGGSSNAAGALRAVNRLLGDPIPVARLWEMAAELGSDVPYFLREAPGAVRMTGRGERLEPVPMAKGLRALLLFPGEGVSTAEVYARCTVPPQRTRRGPAPMLAAIRAGDVAALGASAFNRLTEPARSLSPAIEQALAALESLGVGAAHMTGSGSACFVFPTSAAVARDAVAAMMRPFPPTARLHLGPLFGA